MTVRHFHPKVQTDQTNIGRQSIQRTPIIYPGIGKGGSVGSGSIEGESVGSGSGKGGSVEGLSGISTGRDNGVSVGADVGISVGGISGVCVAGTEVEGIGDCVGCTAVEGSGESTEGVGVPDVAVAVTVGKSSVIVSCSVAKGSE